MIFAVRRAKKMAVKNNGPRPPFISPIGITTYNIHGDG